jgi:hypothetical protein
MSEEWKKHDRPCPPCANCGAELYEKFWGNGGWAKTDKATGESHSESDCIVRLRKEVTSLRMVLDAAEHVAGTPSDDPGELRSRLELMYAQLQRHDDES